jgi:acyl-CoA thioesterase FadM
MLTYFLSVLWQFFASFFFGGSRPESEGKGNEKVFRSSLRKRVYPWHLDTNIHVNNMWYFHFMELARWDMIIRSGLYKTAKSKGFYPVLAGVSFHFRKSLRCFDSFRVETEIVSWDEKWVFIRHSFFLDDKRKTFIGKGIARICFLRPKGIVVPLEEVLAAHGFTEEDIQEASSAHPMTTDLTSFVAHDDALVPKRTQSSSSIPSQESL